MSTVHLLRDYENPDLPLEARLPSLARRFPCLKGAPGLDPFSIETFYRWVDTRPEQSAARHAGYLILSLSGKGPWPRFDAVAAIPVFDEENRLVFANWARTWQK